MFFRGLSYPRLQETLSLKKKVEGAGPEVVRKLSEEREKAESRLRLATRKASELESIADKMKAQLLQAAEDEAKVTNTGAFTA